MAIFSKKRLLKDRRAGLVFHWRGSGNKNTLGYLIGIIVAALVTALLLYGIKVEAPSFSIEQKLKAHKIVLVSEGSSRINTLLELKSPFPEGWDPLDDPKYLKRIESLTRSGMLKEEPKEFTLLGVKEEESEFLLPSLLPAAQYLPELNVSEREVPERTEKKHQLVLSIADQALAQRLVARPTQTTLVASSLRGMTKEFYVSISAGGEIIVCTPLDEVVLEGAELYIRTLKFKPLAGGKDVISKFSLRVEEVHP